MAFMQYSTTYTQTYRHTTLTVFITTILTNNFLNIHFIQVHKNATIKVQTPKEQGGE